MKNNFQNPNCSYRSYLSIESHIKGNYDLEKNGKLNEPRGNYKTIIAVKMRFNTYIYIYSQHILPRYCVV